MAYETFKCMVCDHDIPNIPNIEYCPTCDASILDQSIVGEITEKHHAEFAKHKQEWLKRLESEKNYECEVCETPFDYSQIKTCPTCNFEYPTTPRYRMSENEQILLELKISKAGRKWFKDLQNSRPQILTRTANSIYDLERAIEEKATVINLMPNKYILTRTLNIDYPISFSGTGGIAEIISECDDVAINYSGNGQLHIVNVKFYNKYDKNSTILKISKGSIDIQHCVFSKLDNQGNEILKIQENLAEESPEDKEIEFDEECLVEEVEAIEETVEESFDAVGYRLNSRIERLRRQIKSMTNNSSEAFEESPVEEVEAIEETIENLSGLITISDATGYFKHNQLSYFGIQIDGNSSIELTHNTIKQTKNAIHLAGNSKVKIFENQLNLVNIAINATAKSQATLEKNKFNQIALVLNQSDESQLNIIDNVFQNNKLITIISESSQATFEKNRIFNTQEICIVASGESILKCHKNYLTQHQTAIVAEKKANVEIIDNLFEVSSKDCIVFDDQSTGTFKENICQNNQENGISLSGESSILIENNLLQSNDTAILISHKSTAKIINNTIDKNSDSIIIHDEAKPDIHANFITNSRQGIVLKDQVMASIQNNTISSQTAEAIALYTMSSAEIIANQIEQNQQGIVLNDESIASIVGNQILLNTQQGILVQNKTNAEIKANQIRLNELGILLSGETKATLIENTIQSNKTMGVIMSEQNHSVLQHNQILSNENGICLNDSSAGKIEINIIKHNKSYNIYYLTDSNAVDIQKNTLVGSVSHFNQVSLDVLKQNTAKFDLKEVICNQLNFDAGKYATFQALLDSNLKEVMNAIVNSEGAMNVIVNSKEAMNVIENSPQAMNAIVNSKEASFIYICCVLGFNSSEFTAFDSKFMNEIVSKNLFEQINKNQTILNILYQHAQTKRYQNSSWQDVLTGRHLIVRINCYSTSDTSSSSYINIDDQRIFEGSSNNIRQGVIINELKVVNTNLKTYSYVGFEFAYFPL